jgi:hypothetical protein
MVAEVAAKKQFLPSESSVFRIAVRAGTKM